MPDTSSESSSAPAPQPSGPVGSRVVLVVVFAALCAGYAVGVLWAGQRFRERAAASEEAAIESTTWVRAGDYGVSLVAIGDPVAGTWWTPDGLPAEAAIAAMQRTQPLPSEAGHPTMCRSGRPPHYRTAIFEVKSASALTLVKRPIVRTTGRRPSPIMLDDPPHDAPSEQPDAESEEDAMVGYVSHRLSATSRPGVWALDVRVTMPAGTPWIDVPFEMVTGNVGPKVSMSAEEGAAFSGEVIAMRVGQRRTEEASDGQPATESLDVLVVVDADRSHASLRWWPTGDDSTSVELLEQAERLPTLLHELPVGKTRAMQVRFTGLPAAGVQEDDEARHEWESRLGQLMMHAGPYRTVRFENVRMQPAGAEVTPDE